MKGSRSAKLTDREIRLAENLKAWTEEQGLTQMKIAEVLGLDQGTVSRIVRGEIPCKQKYLDKLCEYFKVSPYVFQPFEEVPIVAALSASLGLDYKSTKPSVEMLAALDKAPLPPVDTVEPGKMYALQIADASFLPKCHILRPGVLLYVQRAPNELSEGDMVVHVSHQNMASLRQLHYLESGDLLLRSLAVDAPDLVQPAAYTPTLDKIIWIKL
jgi:transcriptional regulator with XRE-family HTH domain